MGIGSDAIELLIRLRTSGHLRRRGAVMEIGAQQLAHSFLDSTQRIAQLGYLLGIDRPLSLPSAKTSSFVHGDLRHLETTAPLARDFWRWLEFDYAAIDVDGSEGSIPLDLNYDSAGEAAGKYDLVTNYGTTEHVANQLNAFKVIHELAKPGGIMVHRLPAQGMLNHGLVNYNLKFFWMLARSNGYTFISAEVYQSKEFYGLPDDILDFLKANDPAALKRSGHFRTADASIQAVLEKTYDIPFVAPIDVPSGASTDVDILKKRYWTVFEKDRFRRLEAGGSRPCSHDVRPVIASSRTRYPEVLREALARYRPMGKMSAGKP